MESAKDAHVSVCQVSGVHDHAEPESALAGDWRERDLERFAQRQRTAVAAEPATWLSDREAALFGLTVAVPGQHAGIFETAYHAIASFIARARIRSHARRRRSVAVEAFTTDRA
jgi:hypothetical protein